MTRELDVFFHFLFLVVALFCWQLSAKKDLKYTYYLGVYLYLTLLFDGAASVIMLNRYLAKTLVSNLFLYHIFVPIQCFLIIRIFSSVIKAEWAHRILRFLPFLFILISATISFTIQTFNEYNSYAILIKHALTILLILIYFYEVVSTMPYTKIYLQPIFWISIGFLFYSTINVLLEGFSNYFHTYSTSHYATLYFLYSISNYCLFVLLGIGMIVSNSSKN